MPILRGQAAEREPIEIAPAGEQHDQQDQWVHRWGQDRPAHQAPDLPAEDFLRIEHQLARDLPVDQLDQQIAEQLEPD